jgi:hypothetical protein
MKRILIYLAILLAGCSKTPQCTGTTGSIEFTNLTTDTCYMLVNGTVQAGSLAIVPGNNYFINQVPAGTYSYEFKQANGYLLYASTWSGTAIVATCDTTQVTAP